jgi:NADH dehydrogenase [ubiquinone] 1 alpha subcomplex assembly factor 5
MHSFRVTCIPRRFLKVVVDEFIWEYDKNRNNRFCHNLSRSVSAQNKSNEISEILYGKTTIFREFYQSSVSMQIKPAENTSVNIFDRQAKVLQRERAARAADVAVYDYLKEEVGYRLADRIFDIKRKFKLAVDLGCGRGYVAKHIDSECVEELVVCDMSPTWLEQVSCPNNVKVKRKVVDEESLPFESASLDLVTSSLSMHWVNDLPGAFCQIINCLKSDGVFMGAVFGGDTLYELRSSLQLAELERLGGIAPHISPFTEIRDIGSLLTRAGFTMLTVDTDEIVVRYPSMFELMWDLKGMGESNAAYNRCCNISVAVLYLYMITFFLTNILTLTIQCLNL